MLLSQPKIPNLRVSEDGQKPLDVIRSTEAQGLKCRGQLWQGVNDVTKVPSNQGQATEGRSMGIKENRRIFGISKDHRSVDAAVSGELQKSLADLTKGPKLTSIPTQAHQIKK